MGLTKDDKAFLKPDNTDPFRQGSDSNEGGSVAGAYSADDKAFRKPSWTGERDSVSSVYSDVMNHSGPGGPMLTGGAALPRGGKARFRPKGGPQSNGGV